MFRRPQFAAVASVFTIAAIALTGLGISPAAASSGKARLTCAGAGAAAKFFAHPRRFGVHAQEALYNRSRIGCIPLASNGQPKLNLLQTALREQRALSKASRHGARRALTSVGGPWTSIGPSPIGTGTSADSGRILSMAWDANLGGGTLFIGTADGGVWSSTTPFTTWSTNTDGLLSLTIESIAVDPSDATGMTLYAGTGEQSAGYDSLYGQGVYKSVTGGASWFQVGGTTFGNDTISKIVVDPTSGDVYAGAGQGLYASKGVFMSPDGGTTWTNTSNLAGDSVSDLAVDPAGNVYAAVGASVSSQTDNGIWECLSPCVTNNAFTVIGGGSGATGGFPLGTSTANIKLALAPISPGPPTDEAIYAIASDSAHANAVLGVFETSGTGASFPATPPTWTQDLTPGTAACPTVEIPACYSGATGGQAWYDLYIATDPADTTGNTAYFGLQDIYKTTNGLTGAGTTWTNLTNVYQGGATGVHPDQHGFTTDGAGTFFFGNDGGAWESTDGGSTFSDINGNLTTNQFYDGGLGTSASEGCTSNCDPTGRIGGMQDNGTAQTPLGGGTVWVHDPGFGDGGFALIDPVNNNNRYGENANGGMVNSQDGFMTFNEATNGPPNFTPDDVTACGASNFYAAMRLDPGTPTTLLMGMRDLCETTNADTVTPTWTDISKPGGVSVTAAPISAVAVSDAGGMKIYMADDTGHTYFSTDNGATWTSMDLGAVGGPLNAIASATGPSCCGGPAPSWGFGLQVTGLAADPTTSGVVYATVNGFQGSSANHVFRWTDTGGVNGTWSDISGNLPDEPYDSVTVNPAAPSQVFVGGITGVFVTSNGATWNQMGTGLPNVQVDGLQASLDGTTLVAFTHGRSVWQVTGTPTAVHLSSFKARIVRGWTFMTWRSTQKVAGFNVYAGPRRLNHKLITSRTERYSFSLHRVVRTPRLVAIPLM